MLKVNIQNINFGYFDAINSMGNNKIVSISFVTGTKDVVSDVTLNGTVNVTMEEFSKNITLTALEGLVISKLKERINEEDVKPVIPVTPPETTE